MKIQHIPPVNARYWCAVTLASVFGTNLGDLYVSKSGLGSLGGLPFLVALAALTFWLERRDQAPREVYYWLVIIIIRTGATNIGDSLWVGLTRLANILASPGSILLKILNPVDWPTIPISVVLANSILVTAIFAILAVFSVRSSKNNNSGEKTKVMPKNNTIYWITMISAGVFGTICGDATEIFYHNTQIDASIEWILVLLITLTIWHIVKGLHLSIYWLTVGVARCTGTVIGDYLGNIDEYFFVIGKTDPSNSQFVDYIDALISGTIFGLLLLAWPRRGGQRPLNAVGS